MRFHDTHPSDQDLILAADGELPARRVERLRKHLENCWECRVRARELEGAIEDFVHLHRHDLDPLLPPVSGRRAFLKAELEGLPPSHSPLWARLLEWRGRWIPVAAGAAILALLFLAPVVPRRRPAPPQTPVMYAGFVPISFPATELTPGVARAKTREQVCGAIDENNRTVPVALSRRVFELYGMPGADPKAYEVDYLITPALGGADDIANLWPQAYSATIWNARVKDALEDRLHEMVCRGDIDLATAQREISADWIAAYKKYFHTDKPAN